MASKGIKLSKEHKIKIGLSNSISKLGIKHSKHHCKNIAKALIGNNNFWKNHKLVNTYIAIHGWLLRNYNKATYCQNILCKYPRKSRNKIKSRPLMLKPKRIDYALIKGKSYKRNRKYFIMLCRSCHMIYDRNKNYKQLIKIRKEKQDARTNR